MSAYRFSWLRPGGWGRLGVLGAVQMVFLVPMLWALGVFGHGEQSLQLAGIFLFSSLWFFVALGYGLGWAVRGFMVRLRDEGEEEDGPRTSHPHAPPPGPAGHGHGHAPSHR